MIGSGRAAGVVGGGYIYTVIGPGGSPCAQGAQAGCKELEGVFTSQAWSASLEQGGLVYEGAVTASHTYTGYANRVGIFADPTCDTPGVVVTGGQLISDPPTGTGVTFECVFERATFQRGERDLAVNLIWECRFKVNNSVVSTERTMEIREATLDVNNCVDNPNDALPPSSCPTLADVFVVMPWPQPLP